MSSEADGDDAFSMHLGVLGRKELSFSERLRQARQLDALLESETDGIEDDLVTTQRALQRAHASVKLMSQLGDGDKLTATVDYGLDGGATTYEVSLDHNVGDGRDVSATFGSDSSAIEVEYVDSASEADATWTVAASVPSDASNIVNAAKLTVKRAWQW